MSRKPTILVIENAIDVTGSLHSILRNCVRLSDQYDFEFVLPSNSAASPVVRNANFVVHELPMKEIRRKAYAILAYIPILILNSVRLKKIVRRRNISLIINNDIYNLLPPLSKMFGLRLPYICFVRFMPSKFPPALVNFWFNQHKRYASSIVTVSNAVRRELPEPERSVVIYDELPLRDVGYQTSDSTTILYPGNFIEGKGHRYAIEAFSLISNAFPEWTLKFIGGDMGLAKNREHKAMLIQYAMDKGLGDKVEWHSFTPNLTESYLASSFVLNFSESESFSLTTQEAQFHGRAVVATRCGGPEEIVVDGETGILVPIADISAMKEAIERLIADSLLRRDMGKAGYCSVRDKFSRLHTTEKLSELLDSIVRK